MAFKRKFGGKKKSSFVRVGNMFKSDKQYLPQGAMFNYSTTTKDDYLTAVVEKLTAIAEAGGAARFTLTKWNDQEHPVLSVSEAKKPDSKRIGGGKQDDGFHDGEEEPGQDID